MATEHLWMNYPEPIALHDYRYLGADYRQRERITRKIKRWQRKLANMPTLERQALLAAMASTVINDEHTFEATPNPPAAPADAPRSDTAGLRPACAYTRCSAPEGAECAATFWSTATAGDTTMASTPILSDTGSKP